MNTMKIWTTLLLLIFSLYTGLLMAQDQPPKEEPKTEETQPEKTEDLEKKVRDLTDQLDELLDSLYKKVERDVKPRVSETIEGVIREIQKEIDGIKEEINKEKKDGKPESEKKDRKTEPQDGEESSTNSDSTVSETGRDTSSIAESLTDILDGIDINFRKGKKKLKDVKTRWGLVDLGFASYFSEGNLPTIDGLDPLEQDWISSISWRLHLMNQRINIIDHRLNFVYGIGFTFNSYGLSNPVTPIARSPKVDFEMAAPGTSYAKNKLRATYLHIPLMLNLETNPPRKRQSLHLNAGVYGDVLIKSKMKQKINNSKTKLKDDFNLNGFQYGLIGQVGYGPVTFYGTYGLNHLFKDMKDNGYTVTPFTFGLKLIPF